MGTRFGICVYVLAVSTIVFSLRAASEELFEPGLPHPYIATDSVSVFPADQIRQLAVHRTGAISVPIGCGSISPVAGFVGDRVNPETGVPLGYVSCGPDKEHTYLFYGCLWVGGIVGDDTLLSQPFDVQYRYLACEFWPDDPRAGGIRRSGMYADDEFTAIFTDTVVDEEFVGDPAPYDDTTHNPMNIRITQTSYSWTDSLYDNFVILSYAVHNIGGQLIHDMWVGIVLNADVLNMPDGLWNPYGDRDDVSGILDTFLYDHDTTSHVLIPYSYDLDGDPDGSSWCSNSVRAAISLALLETDIRDPIINFSWWLWNYIYGYYNLGPRSIGTESDPFREFAGGFLGAGIRQEDRYYMMSHPEVDYDQIETGIHDSADGWVPIPFTLSEIPHNTIFLYSLGPTDLYPGDSTILVVAVVIAKNLHVDPSNYSNNFDPHNPGPYRSQLDFGEMMSQHRRADSVYRSGFTLPIPGPPQGLIVVDYEDSFVELAWHPTSLPTLDGYFVYVMDAQSDDTWRRALPNPVGDTACILPIFIPDHRYYFAVSMLDTLGRESRRSMAVSAIPARPHPPLDLTATLDNAVPVLTWRPGSDTALAAFLIYRSEWHGDFELHDSTAAHCYRDTNAGSGIQYRYLVSAKNVYGLESTAAGPVTVLPMAFDRDILFYDLNFDYTPRLDPYHRHYVDRMINSIRVSIPLDYHDIEYGELSLPFMSHYKVIVADMEKRAGYFSASLVENLRVYLEHGGRVFLIAPNVSMLPVPTTNYRRNHFDSGDFFHDKLHLDSSISNAIVFSDAMLHGDLTGCQPASAEYPVLEADSEIIGAAPITVHGYLPLSGLIYPRDDVDILYLYQSMYPDSVFHNQINGIRYIGDSGSFILFNFPLSLMKSPGNVVAFRRALTDLGLNLTCGDVTDDGLFNIGDAVYCINFLYRNGPPPPEPPRADIDCDGGLNLEDVVIMINVIFRDGGCLTCCFQDF